VRLCREFLKCHRRPLNVALHLVTTPLGWFGLLALVHQLHPLADVALAVTYLVVLLAMVPATAWLVSASVISVLLAAVAWVAPQWWESAACLLLGYLGQELAHWFVGERTLQSTYVRTSLWWSRFAEHTLLLLPVLLAVAGRRRQSPLRLLVSRRAVLYTQLTSPDQRIRLELIRSWVRTSQPNLTHSSHWWQGELDGAAGEAFEHLSHDAALVAMIRRFHGSCYEVLPVLGMNELYVTGPPKQSTSDTVFYMRHVDGPWSVFPGAHLYRCMLAVSPNAEVTTHFPMLGTDYRRPEGYRLQTGDAVAFDFNRELHYITRELSPTQTEPRVNLKLHFVAFPQSLPWYGSLLARWTTAYDVRARGLFLQTIDPHSLSQRGKTMWVLGWTKIFEWVVRVAGWTNLAYVALMIMVSLVLNDVRWFVAATSFVHYAIYVGTLRERSPIAFGVFRRNAVFFKTLALSQLFLLYGLHFSGELDSLAVVISGFALATWSTFMLGFNRTYFSAELGFDPPRRIKRFPYGVIPHPMVLGAMAGIAGMWRVESFRQAYGWLIVGHLVCYTIVLAQEVLTTRAAAGQRQAHFSRSR
jgi:hypothetical protein